MPHGEARLRRLHGVLALTCPHPDPSPPCRCWPRPTERQMTSAQVPCCRPYPSPSPSPSPSPNPSPNQVPSGRPSSLTPPAACAASTSKHPLARVRARARAGARIGGGLGWKGGGEGGVSAWLGTEERPRRRSGAPSPPMPPTSTVAGRAVPGQLGGPPRRLSTTASLLPLSASPSRRHASLCISPTRTQALAGGQHRVRHRGVQRREPPSARAAQL